MNGKDFLVHHHIPLKFRKPVKSAAELQRRIEKRPHGVAEQLFLFGQTEISAHHGGDTDLQHILIVEMPDGGLARPCIQCAEPRQNV